MALRPVDLVIAAYNAVLALVWLSLWSKTPVAPWVSVAHGAAAILPWALRGIPRVPSAVRALSVTYPIAALAIFWTELGRVQALRGARPLDATVERLDLALFGVHWHEVWMTSMPQAWMSEIMHFGYFLYYLVLVIPPVAILFARGRDAFRSVALAVMVTYLSCFLFYIVFPVYGPRAMAGGVLAPAPGGLFHSLVEAARERGDSLGTAFPSSHVAGASTVAWVAWRWLPRGWAALLTIAAAMVALSTVYTRNHYAVDALAGLLWVVPLQAWLVPWLERRVPPRGTGGRGKPAPASPHEVSSPTSP
ncbi:MAG TPA: phosphatase PAP2 family protein [Candidatus Eisenbacteria bacterium]|nr:phosphatase PAP2 family protein [Candidatus Eisenbacteria bacterium]